jgi:uncharacterized membrane protein YeaQ/YmgE (transglycosylase-associated protein family)
MEFLGFLIVGLIAGWLAGMLMRGSGFGLLGNIIIGIIGAIIGGYVFRFFGVSTGDGFSIGSLITAFVGAVILLFIIGLFRRGA